MARSVILFAIDELIIDDASSEALNVVKEGAVTLTAAVIQTNKPPVGSGK